MSLKKLFLALIFTATAFCAFGESWMITKDDTDLRNKIDYLNNAYFEGKLRVTVIAYSDETDPKCYAITHTWNESGRVAIAVNPICKNIPEEKLMGILAHELCHVAQFLWDPVYGSAECHTLTSFKLEVSRLKRLGLYVYENPINLE